MKPTQVYLVAIHDNDFTSGMLGYVILVSVMSKGEQNTAQDAQLKNTLIQ